MQRQDNNRRTARTGTGDCRDHYAGDDYVLDYYPSWKHLDDCRQVRFADSLARASTDCFR